MLLSVPKLEGLTQPCDVVRLELTIELEHIGENVWRCLLKLVPVFQVDSARVAGKVLVKGRFHIQRQIYEAKESKVCFLKASRYGKR